MSFKSCSPDFTFIYIGRKKNQKDSVDFLLKNELENPEFAIFDILERKGHF